jgi:hypothetical protein
VRTCRIEPQALDLAEQWLHQRRSEWDARLDRLGEYLKTVERQGEDDDDRK